MFDIKKIMNNLKSLNNKNAIHAYLSSSTTVTTGSNQYVQVPIDSVLAKKGTAFSLSGNKITTNKKMTVKVKAMVDINRESASSTLSYGLIIEKNSYALTYQNIQRITNENYQAITCEAIIDLNANDKIYLDLRSVALTNIATNINSGKCMTSLIVEEI